LPDDEDWLLAPTHAASPPGQKYEVAAERCGCLGNCFVNVYIVTRDHRKTTLSTVQIYTSISLGLSQWLQKSPQKVMKALLWTGTEEVHNGKCIVAWNQIQRLLHLGGLGILDLKRMGMALCLQWLWFWRTDPSRPWS
jgi:hypothetical protein